MAEKHAVVTLVESKVKDYISTLLISYGEKKTRDIISDPARRGIAAQTLAKEIWTIIETQNPDYITKLIKRIGEGPAKWRFIATIDSIIAKKGKEYVKLLKFEKRVKELSDNVDKNYGHLPKKERDEILAHWVDRSKSLWKGRGDLDDDLIKKLDERSEERKKEKEILKERKQKQKDITKKWERGKKSIGGHGEDFFKEGFGDAEIGVGSKLGDSHWTEQRDVWMKWYEQEMENLRTAREKDDISPEEFRKNASALKKYVSSKMGTRGKWSWGMSRAGNSKYGTHLMQVVQLIALTAVGAVVTASFNSLWFFFGFLSVALYFLVPNPNDYEPNKDHKIGSKNWAKSFNPFGKEYTPHNGIAFVKSAAKIAAIMCFAYAFKDLGEIFNIVYIGIAIFGYFLLKVDYDPEVPAEFIESVFRFFIGIFFIPTIFVNIFDSWVLGAIALAFFAVPPLPAAENKNIATVLSRGLSGATAYYEMADKFVFGGLMLFALIGAGVLPLPFLWRPEMYFIQNDHGSLWIFFTKTSIKLS